MSVKYSQEELQEMAIIALEAKRNSDPRWIMLVTGSNHTNSSTR